MLKKLMKSIRRQLLKIDWISREVEAYRFEQKKRRHHERWANRMSTGYAIRNLKPLKVEPFDTLGIVTLEEYHSGRVVDRETMILESTNWGGMKL